ASIISATGTSSTGAPPAVQLEKLSRQDFGNQCTEAGIERMMAPPLNPVKTITGSTRISDAIRFESCSARLAAVHPPIERPTTWNSGSRRLSRTSPSQAALSELSVMGRDWTD